MKIPEEQKIHLQRFGRFWDPESLSFVTSSDAVKREPEGSPATQTLSKPINEHEYFYQYLFGSNETIPELEPDPEPEEITERSLTEKLMTMLTGLIAKRSQEPAIIKEPQIYINNVIPEQPVSVSVEMPDFEETQVIERDEEGFISKVVKKTGRAMGGEEDPDRAKISDVVRERLGLAKK